MAAIRQCLEFNLGSLRKIRVQGWIHIFLEKQHFLCLGMYKDEVEEVQREWFRELGREVSGGYLNEV